MPRHTRSVHGNVYNQLLEYIISADLLFYLLMVVAVMVLRRTKPHADRPYRTWGYPIVPIVSVLLAGLLIVDLSFLAPETSGIGILIVLTGVPAYFFWRKFAVDRNINPVRVCDAKFLCMPAKSKKQQMAAGAALAAKRGQRSKSSLKGASRGMYKSMSKQSCAEWPRPSAKGNRQRKSGIEIANALGGGGSGYSFCIMAMACLKGSRLTLLVPVKG